jgi:hypothetical protein
MMPRRTFTAIRVRLRVSPRTLAKFCLEMERGNRPLTRKARIALARAWMRDKQLKGYPTRRDRWDRLWAEAGGPPEMRAATWQAAEMLTRCGEEGLADWLLAARPEYLNEVATGVAAHALRRIAVNIKPHPWDILAHHRVFRREQALDLYENGDLPDGSLEWAPVPRWLFR